ncbi:hypothetical protein BsWGS_07523 [Bradybaena similaris]
MAQHSSTLLLSLAVVAAVLGASRPHIIGGSINTKRYRHGPANSLLRSVISNIASSRSEASVQGDTSNDIHSLTNGDQDSSEEAEDDLSELFSSVDNQLVRVRLPPAAFSGTIQINPFTRRRREACDLTPLLTKTLNHVFSRLNNSNFLDRSAKRYTEPTILASQTSVCPGSTNVSSTHTEKHLRSNCPWKLVQRDFGVNSYPRYADTAVCLCDKCLGTFPVFRCKKMMAPVTYFQLLGCQDGQALMVRRTAKVAVGCFCASPTHAQETENADVNQE